LSTSIQCPPRGNPIVNVVPLDEGSGDFGYICAHGIASSRHDLPGGPELLRALGQTATEVHLAIFQHFVANDPINSAPTPGAVEATLDNHGVWRHERVPGAVHADEAYPDNTLVVWALFQGSGSGGAGSGNFTVRVTRPFQGRTATQIDCCEGSGSGSGSGRLLLQDGVVEANAAINLAPLLWIVPVAGFLAEHAVLNGIWTLEFASFQKGEVCIWENDGDGATRPHLQLRCENLVAGCWKLMLRHAGANLEYCNSAIPWNPVGPNDLVPDGSGLERIPAAGPVKLTVIPA
jgi:hypothetical protein